MLKNAKIIDLFAGPGGLGEGFCGFKESPFEICMSVEFEENAHNTLKLRAFFRKLKTSEELNDYYAYISSTSLVEKTKKFQIMTANHKAKWAAAEHETMKTPHALGNPQKWKKIKAGTPLRPEDSQETTEEKEIFKRVREVSASHKGKGPLIVIGGPPCQAYSVNGRNRIQAEKNYKPENDERFFLYREYLKILDLAKPDIFVMENVEGILSAKLASDERIFEKIKRELIRPDNNPNDQYNLYSLCHSQIEPTGNSDRPSTRSDKDFVIKASDFGVPQGRKRVIVLGVKRKYGPVESTMTPWARQPPAIGELIGNLPKIRSSQKSEANTPKASTNWVEHWKSNKSELLSLLSNNNEIDLVVNRIANFERKKSKNQSSSDKSKLRSEIKASFEKTKSVLEGLKPNSSMEQFEKGSFLFMPFDTETHSAEFFENHPELANWINQDKEMSGVANHHSRSHMNDDLKRYMFSAAWAKAHSNKLSPSPKSKHFPKGLSPDHKNWESGKHADRFRTIEASQIPLTITSHLRKDGHAQIHYDILQNRSLSVREAARIQTFPDNYYFEGTQGWQFQQVGNAVPPFLAHQIALHVLDILKSKSLL